MKAKTYYIVVTAALLLASPVLWTACTDDWDDHYGQNDSSVSGNASILKALASDPSLANFYKLVQGVEEENMLDAEQEITVWAPLDLTSAQVDSVVAVYEADKADGLKTEDNKAITQFLQNHIALYRRTVYAQSSDTVAMLNGKYMQLEGTSSTSGTLEGNPFSDEVDCFNGILYKAASIQTFFPNIREYVDLHEGLDSVSSFLASYDEYELDENSSVAGGVVDGKTVYLDSVTNLKNDLLTKYGYIQREDSTYYFIAPTNEVWETEYAQYYPYYNYTSDVANADSLADALTKTNILCGRFFNMSKGSKYNYNPADSLCNTQYVQIQSHNPRSNVYYNPQTGILAGLQEVECSNGYLYIDNKGVIDPSTTFFGRKDIEATSSRYYEIPTNSSNEETMTVSQNTYYQQNHQGAAPAPEVSDEDGEDTEDDSSSSSTTSDMKAFNYVQVVAKVSTQHTSLTYTVPETFSNCYYNIYMVTVPDDQTHLPLWFTVNQNVQNADGKFPTTGSYFDNPHIVTEGSVDNSETIMGQSNYNRCFVASAEKVDTILLQSAVKYSYSGAGLDDGVVQFTVSSFGPASASSREKIYTRTLRLNEIIMVPFETEEEAIAAADDIDAFNDELLEANKEN